MSEFYYGWRRKAGCVLLVMSLVLMGMWIRSLIQADELYLSVEKRLIAIVSRRGSLFLVSIDAGSVAWPWGFGGWDVRVIEPQNEFTEQETISLSMQERHLAIRSIPYWSIVIPLTLLSAYLILWPGKRTAKQSREGEPT